MVEYLKKYSGLIALADNPDNLQREAKHVDLARQIVLATFGATSEVADRSETKNVKPDSWEKVLACVAKNKDAEGWASERMVKLDALQNYTGNRDDLIKDMITRACWKGPMWVERERNPCCGSCQRMNGRYEVI
ncbi:MULTISPECIES: hypothetical protein [unclassified Paracoccus (in: a-proteobacteria)]|uniref:hypothetical protein n=1 Tax=unclassified Paracoccus (in: a-proteobacteria) TaxID=2688777 RepID=UPI0015FF4EDE|nr:MULTISPECIES: hypothetical protein [unclassified Paracoccus (in: a-proteobacteria)]MBB1493295.1 hypothetical protein [Paracoccus sp. MC1854]MBB1499760.1 hypothetical protein [Paracoccus sp. MC1862]QQO45760.1 hypothetical protein JGR78_05360 [Paracoccus sp. MC1862]